jgi:tetratricopeptide (TPR) repeat protein
MTEVRRIRELIESDQFASALAAAQALLAEVPENRDALYMSAIAQRYLRQLPEALATLSRLEEIHPDYPRLYQERGYCHVALGAAAAAMEAFEKAVHMSPCLPASWKALHSLYRMAGREAAAQGAAAQIESLARLPPQIVTAYSMYADNELADAERVLRQYLSTHAPQAEGMRLLAQIGMRMDAADDAEVLLQEVVRLDPNYDAARYDYARALLRRHKHAHAGAELEALLKKEPLNRNYRASLASVYAELGDYDRALPIYRDILQETPEDPELHLSIANGLKTLGRTQAAVESYRAAAAARPHYGEAYWSLANLKTFRFSDAEMIRMREDEASPRVKPEDRYHLCFALGKAFEDAGRYAESFGYYERGNALKRSELRYRPELLEHGARLQASLCTREFFASRRGVGCASAAPIFIVGLPRSGSTLLEQILASHSQIEGTMELADVPRLAQDLAGRTVGASEPGYPAILAELNADDFRRCGDTYLAHTRLYRVGRPFFTDKMPNNFRHLGLIHLMFPNAKIIDARRDALACCFSNFTQLFSSGQQFTYSVEDITRYYRMYAELMTHWDDALPGRVLRVRYEDVVDDLEGNVRRILDYCQLDFEPACIEFHKTERRIHTASSEQVRNPISRDGVDRWRRFEPWLEPFKRALGGLHTTAETMESPRVD